MVGYPPPWAVVRTGMASGEVAVVVGGSGGGVSRREQERCEREAAGGSRSGGGPCWGARTKVVGDGGWQPAVDGHVGCRLHFDGRWRRRWVWGRERERQAHV